MMICPRCLEQFGDDLTNCPNDGTELKAFQDQTTQLVGKVLDGRWDIEDKIGEGGMGEVYRARQLNIDRVVAVKVLRLALASTEEYVARFFREADIASSIQHPHFVSIFDFGQTPDDQLLYIAMELLEGESLSDLMKRERPRLLDTLTIACQVCAALAAAHDANIVHRDLKPDNIFLVDVPEGGPFVKVLDFGIAKNLEASTKVTRTGQLFGTPEYMSPEQCEGGDHVDGRSDLYGLGCILYEILTGRSPFRRGSIVQTLVAQVSEDPVPFEDLGLPIPQTVRDIVMKLLSKHPDNRYGSALEARDALEQEINRLKGHSLEIRTYETVSEGIALKNNEAETVSYLDLGHPLQLEGILADSARSAIANEADRRKREESERPTDRLGGPVKRGTPEYAVIMAIAFAPIIAGWFLWGALDRPDDGGMYDDPSARWSAEKDLSQAYAAAQRASDEAAAASDARRRANGIALFAVTVALAPDERSAAPTKAMRPIETRPKVDRPPELLAIRTQTSMSHRLMQNQAKLLECYNRREDPNDGGTVSFDFAVAPDGTANPTVSSSDLESQTVLDCMTDIAQKVRFTKADTAATFRKNLKFSAQKR